MVEVVVGVAVETSCSMSMADATHHERDCGLAARVAGIAVAGCSVEPVRVIMKLKCGLNWRTRAWCLFFILLRPDLAFDGFAPSLLCKFCYGLRFQMSQALPNLC